MSYRRVIPRDLFNEANLLKCYGQIYLLLENGTYPYAELTYPQEGDIGAFDIQQNEDSGGIYIANIHLIVRGEVCYMERPLNSRRSFPLYITPDDDHTLSVFNDDGSFSDEMISFLNHAEEPV